MLSTACTFGLAIAIWFAVLQEPEPFPGMHWGLPLEQAPQPLIPDTSSSVGRCRRFLSPFNEWQGICIQECVVEFTHDRFTGLTFMTAGHENTMRIFTSLRDQFGAPKDNTDGGWQWITDSSYVSLDEDSAGHGYVLWYCIPCQERL